MKQEDSDVDSQDGMDIAICVIDKQISSLTFSGAFNPLCLIRDSEVITIPADRMPVGISSKSDDPFTNHKIDIKKGDKIYLFSDGFHDQFGGMNNKKLKSGPFKKLLLETSDQNMNKQELRDNQSKVIDFVPKKLKNQRAREVNISTSFGVMVTVVASYFSRADKKDRRRKKRSEFN